MPYANALPVLAPVFACTDDIGFKVELGYCADTQRVEIRATTPDLAEVRRFTLTGAERDTDPTIGDIEQALMFFDLDSNDDYFGYYGALDYLASVWYYFQMNPNAEFEVYTN